MAGERLCASCGKPLKEEGLYCIYCGTKNEPTEEKTVPIAPIAADEEMMRRLFGAPPAEPRVPDAAPAAEEEAPFNVRRNPEYSELMRETYAPMGAWNVCGTLLLFSIPVLGLIFAIAFACGACKKRQKKRLAQGYLLFLLLAVVLCGILSAILFLFFWEPVLNAVRQAVPSETWNYLNSVLPFLTA